MVFTFSNRALADCCRAASWVVFSFRASGGKVMDPSTNSRPPARTYCTMAIRTSVGAAFHSFARTTTTSNPLYASQWRAHWVMSPSAMFTSYLGFEANLPFHERLASTTAGWWMPRLARLFTWPPKASASRRVSPSTVMNALLSKESMERGG